MWLFEWFPNKALDLPKLFGRLAVPVLFAHAHSDPELFSCEPLASPKRNAIVFLKVLNSHFEPNSTLFSSSSAIFDAYPMGVPRLGMARQEKWRIHDVMQESQNAALTIMGKPPTRCFARIVFRTLVGHFFVLVQAAQSNTSPVFVTRWLRDTALFIRAPY
jgi:hypothetical protein